MARRADFPHQVTVNVGGPNQPRLGQVLRGAFEIAGSCWTSWRRDRSASDLVVAFRWRKAADQYLEWLVAECWR